MSFYDRQYETYKKLYLAEVLTYGSIHPIKIGISKNPFHRMRQLGQMGIHCPDLIGYFEYNDYYCARDVETILCRSFPRCPIHSGKSREILAASAEALYSAAMAANPTKFIKISERRFFSWELS